MSLKNIEYSSDGKNTVFLFEQAKLNCHCIISKDNQIDFPGLGGTRFIPYNNLKMAIHNAKALSTSMFFKNAIAKLPFAGAKQVIFCKDKNISEKRRNEILSYSAECVNSLKGDFITGTDMGLTAEDVSFMARFSPYILHGESGNTSFDTSIGVIEGLLAMLQVILPHKKKSDLRVLVQGAGKVGSHIIERLKQEDMQVYVSEIDDQKGLKICNANKAILLTDISQFKSDIFMPCAIGNAVSYNLMKNMNVSIIAGAANNQLVSFQEDFALAKNGIFYAPDFVINSGGTIHAASSYLKWERSKLIEKIKLIPQQLREIHLYALKKKIGTYQAAKEYVLTELLTYA